MSGGRIIAGGRGLSRQNSVLLGKEGEKPGRGLTRGDSGTSFGMSGLDVDDEIDDEALNDVRKWLKVVDAFEQPRLVYNSDKKHFERYVQPHLPPSPQTF